MAEVNSNHVPAPPAELPQNADAQMTDADATTEQPTVRSISPIHLMESHVDLLIHSRACNFSNLPSAYANQKPFNQQQPTSTQQDQQQSSTPTLIAPQPQQATTASPFPARTATPARGNEGGGSGSRAASAHPDPAPKMPAEAAPHGAPVRQYLNSKVTGVLMEGMKKLAKERPKDPLRVLGEYLIQRSKEVEPPSSS